MAEESENIEARLAAYIDGDLPPQERIDIEQYLAANPSHADLIAALRQQHAQLSGLPRDKAPAEVMDHIQQHLERHALLSDVDDSATLRPSRWPQWTAIAAMLMLAAGLGLLVYQVLPGGPRGEHLAIEQNLMNSLSKLSTTEPSMTDEVVSAPAGSRALPSTLPSDALADRAAEQASKAKIESSPQTDSIAAIPLREQQQKRDADAAGGTFGTVTEQSAVASPDFVEEMADRMAKDQARRATLSKTEMARHATLTVASSDLAMSSALVAEYLVQNGVAFDTPRAAAPAPVNGPAPVEVAAPAPTISKPAQALAQTPALPPQPGVAAGLAATEPANSVPTPPPTATNTKTLVLHNISAEHARAMLIAISDLQAGKQQVALQPLPPPIAVTTRPAANEGEAVKSLDSPLPQATQSAAAGIQPAVTADGAAAPSPTPATPKPATLPFDSKSADDRLVQAAPAAAKPAVEEFGDLWIVITAAPQSPTPAPTVAPAAAPAAPAPPAGTRPATIPFEQP